MTRRKSVDAAMAAANPVTEPELRALALDGAEHELKLAILATARPRPAEPASRRSAVRRPAVAIGAAALAAVVAVAVAIGAGAGAGGGADPAPAYGAKLVRFAKASPLVLLDEPGWHVEFASEPSRKRGVLRFRQGTAVGAPAAELRWRPGGLDSRARGRVYTRELVVFGSAVRAPVLIYGIEGAGPRKILALWEDHGRLLEFSSVVADPDDFQHRLNALRRVGAYAWLDALPRATLVHSSLDGR